MSYYVFEPSDKTYFYPSQEWMNGTGRRYSYFMRNWVIAQQFSIPPYLPDFPLLAMTRQVFGVANLQK